MPGDIWKDAPWEHPDWYDLHDTTHTAGPTREPEHYYECVLALPPLDQNDHLIDVGAGTGKLARLIAAGYPRLGRVTLIDPSDVKLARAQLRLAEALPHAEIYTLASGLGLEAALPTRQASVVTLGSVLMPLMELHPGTQGEALDWLRRSLHELHAMLLPGARLYAVESLAASWARGGVEGPARRLTLRELTQEIEQAGFREIEVAYRFRDRVVIQARRAGG